jgi:large repetitive protein
MKNIFTSSTVFGFILASLTAFMAATAACTSSQIPASSPAASPVPTPAVTVVPTAAVSPSPSPSSSSSPALTASPPVITTSSLPDGTTGLGYTQTFQATGGSGNRIWAISSGTLPPGLAFDPRSGTISGIPKSAADYFFTVSAIDSTGASSSKSLSINIALPPALVSAIIITTNALPDGIVGSSYSQSLQAIGGSGGYKWSVASGSLPSGLTLDAGIGKIAGTPRSAGAVTLFIEAADTSGTNAVQSMTLVVTNPSSSATPSPSASPSSPPAVLTITSSSMPAGVVGTQYSQPLKFVNGTGPFAWSLQRGSLPSGLLLDAQLGIVFGTPSSSGTSYFQVQITDAAGASSTQSLSITINSK